LIQRYIHFCLFDRVCRSMDTQNEETKQKKPHSVQKITVLGTRTFWFISLRKDTRFVRFGRIAWLFIPYPSCSFFSHCQIRGSCLIDVTPFGTFGCLLCFVVYMYQCRLSTRYLLLMQEYYVQLHVIVDTRNYKSENWQVTDSSYVLFLLIK
jgi:hypothetical protein